MAEDTANMRLICTTQSADITNGYLKYARDQDIPKYFRDRSGWNNSSAASEFANELLYQLRYFLPKEMEARGFKNHKEQLDSAGLSVFAECDDNTYSRIMVQLESMKNAALKKADDKIRKMYPDPVKENDISSLEQKQPKLNEDLLRDFVIEVAEDLGWQSNYCENNGEVYISLMSDSPAGEKVDVLLKGKDFESYKNLKERLYSEYTNFNPDRYAVNIFQSTFEVPGSLKSFLEDAYQVQEMLDDLYTRTKECLKSYETPVKTMR